MLMSYKIQVLVLITALLVQHKNYYFVDFEIMINPYSRKTILSGAQFIQVTAMWLNVSTLWLLFILALIAYIYIYIKNKK